MHETDVSPDAHCNDDSKTTVQQSAANGLSDGDFDPQTSQRTVLALADTQLSTGVQERLLELRGDMTTWLHLVRRHIQLLGSSTETVHCRQTRIGEAANDHTMAIATLYDIDNGLHEILDRYPTHPKITEVRHIRSQLGTALETLYERLDLMRNSSAIVKPHSIHPVPDLVDTELSRSLDSVITRVGPTFIAAGEFLEHTVASVGTGADMLISRRTDPFDLADLISQSECTMDLLSASSEHRESHGADAPSMLSVSTDSLVGALEEQPMSFDERINRFLRDLSLQQEHNYKTANSTDELLREIQSKFGRMAVIDG